MRTRLSVVVWVVLGMAVIGGFGCGGSGSGKPSAWIKEPKGKVEARQNSQDSFAMTKDKHPLFKGGAVRTGEDGTTVVKFQDSSEATVTPEGYLEIVMDSVLATQKGGRVIYEFGKQGSPARIETPHGVTAVLGTKFMIGVASGVTMVAVEEGKVSFTSLDHKEQFLTPGQKLTIKTGEPVPAPINIDPMERENLFSLGKSSMPWINQR